MVKKVYGFRFDRQIFGDEYGELRDIYEEAQNYIFSDDIPEEQALEEIYSIIKEDLESDEADLYAAYLDDCYNDDETPDTSFEYLKLILRTGDIRIQSYTLNS